MINASGVNPHTIRVYARAQLREWMEGNQHQFSRPGGATRNVLDFGAGKEGTCFEPQPYRDLVEMNGARYHPVDVGDDMPKTPLLFDVVMSTQVVNYLKHPRPTLQGLTLRLRSGGTFILTYPTNWAFCEDVDLFRFTPTGMEQTLKGFGLNILKHEQIGCIDCGGFMLPLGYGLIAEKL